MIVPKEKWLECVRCGHKWVKGQSIKEPDCCRNPKVHLMSNSMGLGKPWESDNEA